MSKSAKTKYDIHPLLSERWSPRAFKDQTVENEKLQRIFEASRWAPSASNEQPWFFIIGQNNDHSYQRIFDCLVEFNQMWAKFAPVLILSIGRKTSMKSGDKNPIFKYDIGQSVSHLLFQANHEGLYAHQMTGFNAEKATKLFEVPYEYQVISVIALGYLGDPEILHPRMQKSETAERNRKELTEFIFTERFGNTSDIIK